MSWQYRTIKNVYGEDQCVDYSTCPPKPVCSECYLPYNNVGQGLVCSDCRGEHEQPVYSGQTTCEITNKHGYVDHVLVNNGEWQYYTGSNNPILVCPQCKAMVLENHGDGCLCDQCKHELEIECMHDYDDGLL